jgi:hypothetical protein
MHWIYVKSIGLGRKGPLGKSYSLDLGGNIHSMFYNINIPPEVA